MSRVNDTPGTNAESANPVIRFILYAACGCWLHHCCERSYAADAVTSMGESRILEIWQDAGDDSPTLHKGHSWIFNIHPVIVADGTPSLMPIQSTARTMMPRPVCETSG